MSSVQEKTTYTLSEAAKLLSCHKETIRRAIHNGHLRAAKLGRGFRISRIDLEAFWTASGGGLLFETSNDLETPLQEKKPKATVKKQSTVPCQLSLLSDNDPF